MQVTFGSIISLQILAHIPLANIALPANALQSFEIMMEVVKFDYLEFTNYVDLGFTETEAWSDKFEQLGYESVNFIENQGSVQLILWGYYIMSIFVILFWLCRKQCCKHPRVQKCFSPLTFWYS